MPDPVIVSVHPFRRTARRRERELQALLDEVVEAIVPGTDGSRDEPGTKFSIAAGILANAGVPGWAGGVKVDHAGRFQWAVIATERAGH